MPDWTTLDQTFCDCFAALDSGFQTVDSSRRETADALSGLEAAAAQQARDLVTSHAH